MRYKSHDISWLITLSLGRRTLLRAIFFRLRIFLMPIARFYRRFFLRTTCVIAVTGSFGKTTTTKALKSVLLRKMPLKHNRNVESLVAIDILRTHTRVAYAVFETGIDRPGRMMKFARMIQPNIVVVTSIGREHHTSLKSLENTRNEKAEMVRALPPSGIAVLNADDPNVIWMKTQTAARVVTYGFDKDSDIHCKSVNYESVNKMNLCISVNGEIFRLNTHLIGEIMTYPILATFAVAWVNGIDLNTIKPFLEPLTPVPGRLQPVVLKNRITILRDDFKAPLETVEAALDTFEKIPAKRRIAVIGEIEELYGKADPTYRWLGERVARITDIIIFIGGKRRLRPFRTGVRNKGFPDDQMMYAANSIRSVAEILKEIMEPDDLVLLKGSSSIKLSRVISILEGETVRCELKKCTVKFTECKNCPMLERRWANGRTSF